MIPVVLLGIGGGSFLAFRALRPVRNLVDTVRSLPTDAGIINCSAGIDVRPTVQEQSESCEVAVFRGHIASTLVFAPLPKRTDWSRGLLQVMMHNAAGLSILIEQRLIDAYIVRRPHWGRSGHTTLKARILNAKGLSSHMDHLDPCFSVIASDCVLPSAAARELRDVGFVVIAGPVVQARLSELVAAYDAAVLAAHPDDVSIGSSTTRVHDFVNRGPQFDELYVYRPVLAACCSIIGQPFKLSTMLARAVNPNSLAQQLHVDFPREADGWPMVGFIVMVDEFRSENGATRFVPGSHLWPRVPGDLMEDPTADYEGPGIDVSVCGPAGSIVIYNGSVWHGHGANRTGQPRRSIQGAYIRRDAQPAVNQAARISPDTLSRISELAKYVLAV